MNLFVLKAVLGLDTSEYDRGIDDAGKKASVFGDMLKANLVTKGIEVAVSGMKKLGNATVSMVQQSVNAFADYEQLAGGVETLFKDSADTVMQYAQDAYINAGLSANQYMETVTSFSASLIQSLGGDTAQAAELANLAIEDMSDNANKMGSDIASIQNAYAGFAKQNYTMLDNLKLGYGGTKSEMDRLIKDAMKLDKTFKVATKTTKNGKKTNKELAYSYADIVKAIHIVQDEMGITGTTALEAEKTISGSLNRVKAAWQNLLSGLGEGSDEKVDMLVEQLIDSAEIALKNILPVVENIIYGIVTVIEGLAPIIAEKLPGFLERILPGLTKAAATLISAFAKAIIQNIPAILDAVKEILVAVYEAIEEAAPGLMPALFGIGGIKVATTIAKIVESISGITTALKGAQTAAIATQTTVESASAGMTTALAGVSAAAAGVVAALALAYDVKQLNDAYKGYKEAGDAHMREREQAIETYRQLVEEKGLHVANQWAHMVYGIEQTWQDQKTIERIILNDIENDWKEVPQNLWDGFKQGWEHYFGKNGVGFIALIDDGILGPVRKAIKDALDWGGNIISSFWEGAKRKWQSVKSWFSGVFSFGNNGASSNASTISSVVENASNNYSGNVRSIANNAGTEYTVPRSNAASGGNTIIMMLNGTEVGRAFLPYIEAEQQRVGVRLATGGAL